MFSQLKEQAQRVSERLRDLTPADELDRKIEALLAKGSEESLLAPAWDANMALVDLVNRHILSAEPQ